MSTALLIGTPEGVKQVTDDSFFDDLPSGIREALVGYTSAHLTVATCPLLVGPDNAPGLRLGLARLKAGEGEAYEALQRAAGRAPEPGDPHFISAKDARMESERLEAEEELTEFTCQCDEHRGRGAV